MFANSVTKEKGNIGMPKKQPSNLGHLMDLLNISAVELSKAINIDQTSISRWRTGVRKPPVDMPYFESIISYFLKKNKEIGNDLLEDFFKSVYLTQDKKRPTTDYLKKCIRNYILEITEPQLAPVSLSLNQSAGSSFACIKYIGLEERRKALMSLIQAAAKQASPVTVKIFSCDHLEWLNCDMHYLHLFHKNMKNLLSAGHAIEFIFNVTQEETTNMEAHKMFLEFSFSDRVSIYNLPNPVRKIFGTSLYVLPGRLAVVCHLPNDDGEMVSYSFQDRQCVAANEAIFETIKQDSNSLLYSTKPIELDKTIEIMKSTIKSNKTYYYSAKTLSFTTMSEELFSEILDDNKLTDRAKQRCFDMYHLFRANIENSASNQTSGFYYSLDEITACLAFKSIINYPLSATANKIITITREQYLRHFRETAQLLLKDSRYRVFLHYSQVFTTQVLWYCEDAWAITYDLDEDTEKIKFNFTYDKGFTKVFKAIFLNTYDKLYENRMDNKAIAELFMKIADQGSI